MKAICTPQSLINNHVHELTGLEPSPHSEVPQRVHSILASLKEHKDYFDLEEDEVEDFGIDVITRIHSTDYVEYLKTAYDEWLKCGMPESGVIPDVFSMIRPKHIPTLITGKAGYYAFDLNAIIGKHTFSAAYYSAMSAVKAAHYLLQNPSQGVFSLCRPPGHHASKSFCGGFCYFNNAAIAAQYLIDKTDKSTSKQNGVRVCIFDVDYHHGNGTQDIFYDRNDVLYVSIHAKPDDHYPFISGYEDEVGEGEGQGYTANYPLSGETRDEAYLSVFNTACDKIKSFQPEYMVVSLGVDTYVGDMVGDFYLSLDAYTKMGNQIGKLNIPTLFVMEGGYDVENIGKCVSNMLKSFIDSHNKP